MVGAQSVDVQERQAGWMADHHRYLLDRFSSDCKSCLDVGCGAGYVMESISDMINVRGIDIEPEQVRLASERGLDVIVSNGLALPYPDSSFDMVICSFYLMWIDRPGAALNEMLRVAGKRVIILAEPVWSATMTDPEELETVVSRSVKKIREEGGDPDAGKEVLNLIRRLGLDHRYGTIPLDTSPRETLDHIREEAEINGMTLSVPEPILFNVPFIWAAIGLS
jgi:SAM-dependent methyltransferase